MTDHPRDLTGYRFFARGAGAAVILIGGLVLTGWAFDVAALKSLTPGLTAMNPGGTALAFVLAGVSLWAQSSAGVTPRPRGVGIACAAGVLLIGIAAVLGFALPRHLVRTRTPEPAGAAAVAALLADKIKALPEGPVVAVVTGGNVDLPRLAEYLSA